jgi:ATP-dependent DNA helicase RecG
MQTSLEEFAEWLDTAENQHLEFKEAKTAFEFDELVKYCAAIANEGGGKIVLGVTDKLPRQVVGSQAFKNPEQTVEAIFRRLSLRVNEEILQHPQGRVLIFHVPSRPLGLPISLNGAYWMRAGASIASMSPEMLKKIFEETGPDFSAEYN